VYTHGEPHLVHSAVEYARGPEDRSSFLTSQGCNLEYGAIDDEGRIRRWPGRVSASFFMEHKLPLTSPTDMPTVPPKNLNNTEVEVEVAISFRGIAAWSAVTAVSHHRSHDLFAYQSKEAGRGGHKQCQ
jgi:hypothetical protein